VLAAATPVPASTGAIAAGKVRGRGPGQPLRRGRPPAAHGHTDSFDVDDQPDHPRRRPGQPDVYEPGSTVPT